MNKFKELAEKWEKDYSNPDQREVAYECAAELRAALGRENESATFKLKRDFNPLLKLVDELRGQADAWDMLGKQEIESQFRIIADRLEQALAEMPSQQGPRFSDFCDALQASNVVDESAVYDPEDYDGGRTLRCLESAYERLYPTPPADTNEKEEA